MRMIDECDSFFDHASENQVSKPLRSVKIKMLRSDVAGEITLYKIEVMQATLWCLDALDSWTKWTNPDG